MGPIRAEFWLKAVPLASWSRRHCRKTGRASGVGSIPRSKMALSVIWTHASHEFVSNPSQSNTLRRCWIRRRSKFRDHLQDVSEEISRNGDLGHLEGDITAVVHHLCADLDQLLFQPPHRPILDRLRRSPPY